MQARHIQEIPNLAELQRKYRDPKLQEKMKQFNVGLTDEPGTQSHAPQSYSQEPDRDSAGVVGS